jgi:hypothetical protein
MTNDETAHKVIEGIIEKAKGEHSHWALDNLTTEDALAFKSAATGFDSVRFYTKRIDTDRYQGVFEVNRPS